MVKRVYGGVYCTQRGATHTARDPHRGGIYTAGHTHGGNIHTAEKYTR